MRHVHAADHRLVAAATRGDAGAFQELFRRYYRLVTVSIYQKVRGVQDVEDLTQETFLRAWRALPKLRNPDRFLPWLIRIARRLTADWHRARSRTQGLTNYTLEALATEDDPSGRLSEAEQEQAVLEALDRLPDRYRLVLTLRFLEGLAPLDIANRLGEPSGTIRNRIFRALAKLQKLMNEDEDRR